MIIASCRRAELASNLSVGYKQHDTDDPRQKWEEFAAMHVTPVRCHSHSNDLLAYVPSWHAVSVYASVPCCLLLRLLSALT